MGLKCFAALFRELHVEVINKLLQKEVMHSAEEGRWVKRYIRSTGLKASEAAFELRTARYVDVL